MKLFTRVFLFLFIVFLSTPTLVTMLEKDTDTSMFYCFAEEEHQKEVKAEVKYYIGNSIITFSESKEDSFIVQNNSEHPTVFREIFSPPPNFI